jgi:hypothetical protein
MRPASPFCTGTLDRTSASTIFIPSEEKISVAADLPEPIPPVTPKTKISYIFF